ncbi:MAG TPA: CBS domain-containing protein [Anaerolineae bacterium]|nr:CBS domain-containing protein [Anaerolineae bacterium]HQI87224.1 CBS domain-containing protein [Anaerolineae bacterium]
MLYVSQMQNRQVWDAWGNPVGRCADVLVGAVDRNFPPVKALLLRGDADKNGDRFIPASCVSSLYPSITLNVPQDKCPPYTPTGDELRLIDRVLDRQIVDTEGRRVVRVNDLQLARVGDQYCLTGVDVGGRGLLRRLGLEGLGQALSRLLGRSWKTGVIPWEDVAPLHQEDPLRLRVSHDRIVQLPPADLAAILNDLDHRTGAALMETFSNETLADALEESPAEVQVAVLSHMEPERAADVLEEMDPDEAADLLADLPEQTSEQLLSLMEDAEAAEVRSLLVYPEDSAGGIMTTEFAHAPIGLRAGELLDYLRHSEAAGDDEVMYYVYLVDEDHRLRGVISLRDLVMAPPDADLTPWIDLDPVTVTPYTPQEEVAYIVAKYDLLAAPVVDPESGKLLGIVTVDDAVDTVLPTAWKKRLPRFF